MNTLITIFLSQTGSVLGSQDEIQRMANR